MKSLKSKGIFIPDNLTVPELRTLNENAKRGPLWIIRVHRPPPPPFPELQKGHTYWLHPSQFATALIETRLIYTVGRRDTPPESATYMPVPDSWGEEEE